MTVANTFHYGAEASEHRVRVLSLNGAPWFVAGDVCRALGAYIQNGKAKARDATRRLGPDEVRVEGVNPFHPLKMDPRAKSVTLISESGLYKLVMRSDKPEARAFQEWVTREVLPAIRKTGGYRLQGAAPEAVQEGTVSEMPDVGGVMAQLAALKDEMAAQEARMGALVAAEVKIKQSRCGRATH